MTRKRISQEKEDLRCPECGSRNLKMYYDRGELVCEECGLVLDDTYIDQGPEWRAFDSDQSERRARTGAPTTVLIHDKGLSTEISWANRDAYGKRIPNRNRATVYRVRKWHKRMNIGDAEERNLSVALQELSRISSKLGLPRNIRETAAMIYRKALEKNLARGRSIEHLVAASVYASCRQCGVPRTIAEVSEAADINKKKLGRAYRHLARGVSLNLKPSTPDEYLSRFCNKLGVPPSVQIKGMEILEDAGKLGVTSGKGPTGLAAAAIYISCILTGNPKTQKEVSEATGITEVTIRNRYKEICAALDIDLNSIGNQ